MAEVMAAPGFGGDLEPLYVCRILPRARLTVPNLTISFNSLSLVRVDVDNMMRCKAMRDSFASSKLNAARKGRMTNSASLIHEKTVSPAAIHSSGL